MSQPNTPCKFLLVKLSSLGDVLHNLPIVWDIRQQYPQAQIDWVVEEAYVDLLKPLQSANNFKGIDRIIPIGLRRWKKNVFSFQVLVHDAAMMKVAHPKRDLLRDYNNLKFKNSF